MAGVLWIAFSGGLRVYIQLAQAGNAVFGALGGVLIVLLWFWLLALAVLIGGEMNQICSLPKTAVATAGSETSRASRSVGDERGRPRGRSPRRGGCA